MSPAATVALDGTGSGDPEGASLAYSWSTTCDGTFNDNTLAQPILTVASQDVCNYSCSVSLVVTDDQGLSSLGDSAIVTIVDTLPLALVGVPGDATVECNAVPQAAMVTAADMCGGDILPGFDEIRLDGSCADNYTLTRTWTAVDGCGYNTSAAQVLSVQDTTGPVIACNSPATITPSDAPVSFTASATDNCAEAPSVAIIDYDCFFFTKKGKRIDKTESCIVEIEGETVTIKDSGGVNDNITWTVEAADNCGNVVQSTCAVNVVN